MGGFSTNKLLEKNRFLAKTRWCRILIIFFVMGNKNHIHSLWWMVASLSCLWFGKVYGDISLTTIWSISQNSATSFTSWLPSKRHPEMKVTSWWRFTRKIGEHHFGVWTPSNGQALRDFVSADWGFGVPMDVREPCSYNFWSWKSCLVGTLGWMTGGSATSRFLPKG